jgi:hypothetical protein
MKEKIRKLSIIILSLFFLQVSTMSADAAINGFIQKDAAGVHYEYEYSKLQSDYVKYQLGLTALLYADFTANNKSTIALKDSIRGYVKYSKVQSAYVMAQMMGTPFDANNYTETIAELYSMPLSVTKVSLVLGVITREEVTEGPTLSNVTIGFGSSSITPVISGTATAPVLTFTVNPAQSYTTGTAALSTSVAYRIQSGSDVDITGSATISENLVQTALTLFAFQGGSSGEGVLGSVLVFRSPVTITLTANSVQTVYTINFVAQ